ncbi:hypothetical protein PIB30_040821 [Stylosanthes scabra]|uniref:Uncharacterized protein n=1 Tax=Stylosanthes scabra TaxID=79078 RepID=A0ABU6UDC7_9FABA|nr:hypothetical protein [Stylosanthes scabra]
MRQSENWGAIRFMNGATCYDNESMETSSKSNTEFASAAKKSNNQDLSDNSLSGTLPYFSGQLQSLEHLILGRGGFGTILGARISTMICCRESGF